METFNSKTDDDKERLQRKVNYLTELLLDKSELFAHSNVYIHVQKLLDEEIGKVRSSLILPSDGKKYSVLPDPEGPPITVSEKIYLPTKERPDYNFVGRILGPRGLTAKHIEHDTGCIIRIRGRGSQREEMEENHRRKYSRENFKEELHVLIMVRDSERRAKIKLQRAVDQIRMLLIPGVKGDEFKKSQLMEHAIITGKYRASRDEEGAEEQLHQLSRMAPLPEPYYLLADFCKRRVLRPPWLPFSARLSSPLICPPFHPVAASSPPFLDTSLPPPTISRVAHRGLLYPFFPTTPEYNNYAPMASNLLAKVRYSGTGVDPTEGVANQQRANAQCRSHPYQSFL